MSASNPSRLKYFIILNLNTFFIKDVYDEDEVSKSESESKRMINLCGQNQTLLISLIKVKSSAAPEFNLKPGFHLEKWLICPKLKKSG